MDDEETPSPAGENAEPVGQGVRWPSVDEAVKLVALAGVLLYGVLFLGYRRYYTAIAVAPEDVGITNSYVLARSPGFIVLTLAVGTAVLALVLADARPAGRDLPGARRVTRAAAVVVPVLAGYYFYSLFPLASFWFLLLFLAVLGALPPLLRALDRTPYRTLRPVLAGAVTALLAVGLPAVGVVEQGAVRGDQARQGHPVTPFSVLGIPVVDVSAPHVVLTWADPDHPPPSGLFGSAPALQPAQAVLLGETDRFLLATVLTADGPHVVRFTTGSVVVELP